MNIPDLLIKDKNTTWTYMKDGKPYPRSYWVQRKNLLAGYNPNSNSSLLVKSVYNISRLLDVAGIRTFINLMEEDETDWQGNIYKSYKQTLMFLTEKRKLKVQYLSFPIKDLSIPSKNQMKEIISAIDYSINCLNMPVYVHCRGGIGRTGTVVGCWLIEHRLADKDNFMECISMLRKGDSARDRESPETNEQRQFCQVYDRV